MNRLATIFSIVTTAGLVLAIVSGVIWAIAALRHRQTAAKLLCLAGIAVTIIAFAMFLRSYDSSLHQNTVQPPEPPTVQDTTPAPEPALEVAQEPTGGPDEPSQAVTPPSSVEAAETPEEPPQEAETSNPLSSLGIQEHPVMNGFKTERIGTWASVTTTKEYMRDVTDQQLYDYLTEIEEKGYNWFNIFFEDGTGLDFATAFAVTYGPLDQEEGGTVSMFDGRLFMYDPETKTYQEQEKKVDEAAINAALLNEIPQSFQGKKRFFAYALATGTTNNSASVSMQIDQGSDSQENAQELAIQFYTIAKDVVENFGCQLESFDIMVVNDGASVGWYTTQDGRKYNLFKDGKKAEIQVP